MKRRRRRSAEHPSRGLDGASFDRWIAAMRSHEAYEARKLYPYVEYRWQVSLDEARTGHDELHARADEVTEALPHRDANALALRPMGLVNRASKLCGELDEPVSTIRPRGDGCCVGRVATRNVFHGRNHLHAVVEARRDFSIIEPIETREPQGRAILPQVEGVDRHVDDAPSRRPVFV
ncbi:MAG: hypothetical protein WCE62_12680 [Polyangiales bacterium]